MQQGQPTHRLHSRVCPERNERRQKGFSVSRRRDKELKRERLPCLPGQMKAVKRVPTSGSKCVAAGFGCWVAADDMGPYQSPAGGWTNSPATGVQVCRTTRILELGLFHRSLLPSHSFSHFLNGIATTYITKRPSTQHYFVPTPPDCPQQWRSPGPSPPL